jgi:spore germination cell wall hydrolase CwlJ-like protein
MPQTYTMIEAVEFALLVTVVGREARGESQDAMLGVAWSIRNRVDHPGWWGNSWETVITKPMQYTSIAPPTGDHDPNLTVYPDLTNDRWMQVAEAAEAAYWAVGKDPVFGATHYFDKSLDATPPQWTKAPTSVHVCDIGDLRFWKVA